MDLVIDLPCGDERWRREGSGHRAPTCHPPPIHRGTVKDTEYLLRGSAIASPPRFQYSCCRVWPLPGCTMLVLCGHLTIRPLNVPRSAAIQDTTQQVHSNRPVCIRLNYQLVLRATRPAAADQEIRMLIGDVEPAEVVPSDTREAFRYSLAEYNALGQFGGAGARKPLR
jgi:hypothetical protein